MSKAEDMQQGITKIQQMHARIATLEAENAKLREVVRGVVDAGRDCINEYKPLKYIRWLDASRQAIALLQPEAEKEVGK